MFVGSGASSIARHDFQVHMTRMFAACNIYSNSVIRVSVCTIPFLSPPTLKSSFLYFSHWNLCDAKL